MTSKIFGFALVFSLLLSPAFAQDESLIDDAEADDPMVSEENEDDMFGGDFFSDLDSFLAESEGEADGELAIEDDPAEATPADPVVMEDDLAPIAETNDEALIGEADTEDLQSSAMTGGAGLPATALVTLSAVNVSQDNANAATAGARPGDVIRYEISLSSQVDDVIDYVPVVNVGSMAGAVEFTNTGFGVLEGENIVYPAYSHQAPCEQVFTFFVRVLEDCGELTSLSVSSGEAGALSVPLNCGLTETGPMTQRWFLLAGLIMLLVALGFGISGRAKTS